MIPDSAVPEEHRSEDEKEEAEEKEKSPGLLTVVEDSSPSDKALAAPKENLDLLPEASAPAKTSVSLHQSRSRTLLLATPVLLQSPRQIVSALLKIYRNARPSCRL